MLKFFPPLKNVNIPNLVTTFSVLIGLLSFFLALNNKIIPAVAIMPATIICDRLDGYLARKLNAFSEFGKSLDSFADLFNFCFLPAFIVYYSGFDSPVFCIILVIYYLSGLWRLSHFNISEPAKKNGKPCFVGLATPYAAGIFVVLFALKTLSLLQGVNFSWCFGIFFFIMAVLHVSSIKIEKNGLLTKILFVLTPIALVFMCIKYFWF